MSKEIQNHPEIFERKESLVPFHKAHKHFPGNPSPSSVYRWYSRGVSTSHGHFKLETAVSGSRRYTSEEAIQRFLVVQQGMSTSQTSVVSVPASGGMTKREREKEMKRLGLRPQKDANAGQSKTDPPD